MSTALAKPSPGSLKAILASDKMQQQFAAALPKHLSPERFTRVAITALTRTPKLQECTQESFFKCLLDLSAMGLEPDGRRAHLIPYRDNKRNVTDCTLIVDYKGLVELVRRDPSVVDVQCYTIRETDQVSVRNGVVDHSYNPLADRGEVVAVYTRIDWKNGHTSYGEPMTKPEAEKIRSRSRAGNGGPWVSDFVEMWKKTAIRRDSKMWPLSPEIMESVVRDDDQFRGMRNVTPAQNPFLQEKSESSPEVEAPAGGVKDPAPETPSSEKGAGSPTSDHVEQVVEEKLANMARADRVKAYIENYKKRSSPKDAKKPWTLHIVELNLGADGGLIEATTFDNTLGVICEFNTEQWAWVELRDGEKGKELADLEIINEEGGEA